MKGCLDKYIKVATWPPQTKIPDFAFTWMPRMTPSQCQT